MVVKLYVHPGNDDQQIGQNTCSIMRKKDAKASHFTATKEQLIQAQKNERTVIKPDRKRGKKEEELTEKLEVAEHEIRR